MPLNQPTNTNAADFTGGQPVDCPGGFTSSNSQSPAYVSGNTGAATFPDGISLPAGQGILVNGVAGTFTETWSMGTVAPSATSITLFVAPRPVTLLGIEIIFTTAAGGVSTLTITHETGVQAPGAGTTTQTGSFNLNATGNTAQAGVIAGGSVAIAQGDRLSTKFANAIQSTAGLTITMLFAPA